MNIIHSISPFIPLKQSSPLVCFPTLTFGCYLKNHQCTSHSEYRLPSCRPLRCSVGAAIPSDQGTDYAYHFEDIVEKDWSFLEDDTTNTDVEYVQKIDRIISAGNIEQTSKVMVCVGSESFVDRVVYSSPCEQLLVVHDSLLVLACIKEKYDKVKCWQGELINVPEKWTSFDVVYLYFLPALPFGLDQVLEALAQRCSPGARVVISHPQGREVVEEQRQQFPDIVVSTLPDKMMAQSAAANHGFEMVEFVDDPGLYLVVLKCSERSDK